MANLSSHSLPDIRLTLVIHAPEQTVWEAVATSEGLASWFMPNDLQPVTGHPFHLNAGPYGMSPCTITEVEPMRRIAFRWGKDWELAFELLALDGSTELTIIHSGWDAAQMTEAGESHRVVRERMEQGWLALQAKLAAYAEGA